MTAISRAWIFPALMMIVLWQWIGLNHPVPMNLCAPLSPSRRIWAVVALLALLLCVTPTPIWQR